MNWVLVLAVWGTLSAASVAAYAYVRHIERMIARAADFDTHVDDALAVTADDWNEWEAEVARP